MKKFFYVLGVYHFCVFVNNTLKYIGSDDFRDTMSELSDEVNRIKSGEKKKEEPKGAVVAKVVKHRIGF